MHDRPGRERQPSSATTCRPLISMLGFTTASSTPPYLMTNSRRPRPICGAARPTPPAHTITLNIAWTTWARLASNAATGVAARRSTGSGETLSRNSAASDWVWSLRKLSALTHSTVQAARMRAGHRVSAEHTYAICTRFVPTLMMPAQSPARGRYGRSSYNHISRRASSAW